MSNILIQAIGFVGVGLFVTCFQLRHRTSILICAAIGTVAFIVHFSLLHAWTGVALCTVNIVRNLVFIKAKNKALLVSFLAAYVVSGVVTWMDWKSALIIVASVAETAGLWVKDERRLRKFNLIPHPLWGTYNFLVGSIPGTANEIFVLGSLLVAIWRLDIRRKP